MELTLSLSYQGTVPNYYRKIEPRDAWVLERKIVAPSA
jgi:hypothetical protein